MIGRISVAQMERRSALKWVLFVGVLNKQSRSGVSTNHAERACT